MRAEHDSYCELCDDRVRPGDDIRRVGDAWVHVDCQAKLEGDVDTVLGRLGLERKRCPVCADTLQLGVCTNCT